MDFKNAAFCRATAGTFSPIGASLKHVPKGDIMKTRSLIAILILFLTACASPEVDVPEEASPTDTPSEAPTTQPEPESEELIIVPGEPFSLRHEQSAYYSDAKLQITFDSIVQDSRCPQDVDCIWAGEVQIELLVEMGPEALHPVTLTLGFPADERAVYEIQGYRITLLEVNPYPGSPNAENEVTSVVLQVKASQE